MLGTFCYWLPVRARPCLLNQHSKSFPNISENSRQNEHLHSNSEDKQAQLIRRTLKSISPVKRKSYACVARSLTIKYVSVCSLESMRATFASDFAGITFAAATVTHCRGFGVNKLFLFSSILLVPKRRVNFVKKCKCKCKYYESRGQRI